MPETDPKASLDAEAVAAADPSGQVFDVLALPEQLRDALFKAESAELPETDSPGGLVVAGMGGSGVGGRLARAILGDEASRPVLSSSEYMLPPWTTADTTVLLASYSGETEETLACYEAAGIIGAPRVVVTSGGTLAQAALADGVPVIPVAGGLQPRAAVAYMTVAALETGSPGTEPHLARRLEARLLDGLSAIPGAMVIPTCRKAGDSRYCPQIVCIAFPGLGGETMVRLLDAAGIAVSTGSACSSSRKDRRVLDAMGVPQDLAFSTIRVSTGRDSTDTDIDAFLEHAAAAYRRYRT